MSKYKEFTYDNLTLDLGVKQIDAATETLIGQNVSPVTVVTDMPNSINRSWYAKRDEGHVKSSDVILFGMETIGASERATNPENMRERFYQMQDGNFAKTLFETFGQKRVEKELGEFLSLEFFPRSTGSIGLTRMIRAMREQENALQNAEPEVPYFEHETVKPQPKDIIFNS